MSTMDNLNAQYTKTLKDINVLRQFDEQITALMGNGGETETSKAKWSGKLLSDLSRALDITKYSLLMDAASIGSQYVKCLEAIDAYRKVLSQQGQNDVSAVFDALNGVKSAQSIYDEIKASFHHRYNYSVDSAKALNLIISTATRKTLSKVQQSVDQLKNEAREIAANEYSTELRATDPIVTGETLPIELLVARNPVNSVTLDLLRDIGITHTYQNISTNLKQQGNVMLISDYEHIEDSQIDEFIIAYILRFIENFPLGAVNVHVFDQNTNYLYKRLNNSFQSENSTESAKRIIQIHTSLSDLATFRDVTCEDIFRKTSVSKPDLYSIYEEDKSDPFNLIILRDGMVDGSGYASAEILNTINSLTKPGDMGHRCGLRFLIVDNSASFEKNLTASNKFLLNSIKQNCSLKIQYSDKTGFSSDGKLVDVLHIAGNLDAFVQERSMAIANAINSKEKSYISLNEVAAFKTETQPGSIMYIPVGKSGGSVVELPLSCKDEDGTVAGQCIGYIAIGQSGSGKSSFFHSLVLNGCLKYSPKDLQFWLLDFKNGGASSKYSDCGIPHKLEDSDRIINAASLQFIDGKISSIRSKQNASYNDYTAGVELCLRQQKLLEYFKANGWDIPQIDNQDPKRCAELLQNRQDSISVSSRIVEADRQIDRLLELAQRELSTNICDQASKLISELERDVAISTQKHIPLPAINNQDTKKLKKRLSVIRSNAEQKEVLHQKIIAVDQKISSIVSNPTSSPDQWRDIVALCKQQDEQIKECQSRQWPIPTVCYSQV